MVTVFLNGFGVVTPVLGTGVMAGGPAVSLAPSLDAGPFTGTTVIATKSLPGSITGVAGACDFDLDAVRRKVYVELNETAPE
jgi:hypothetical protein